MAGTKPKREKYIVTQPGVRLVREGDDAPVGSVVELTERKAGFLINKVALLTDENTMTDALAKSTAQVARVQTELNAVRDNASELREEVAALKTANDSAEARVAEALAVISPETATKIKELEEQVKTANGASEALTEANKALTVANGKLETQLKAKK